MQNYIGLIEFEREVKCKADALGKQINTTIGGVPVVVITPEAAKEPDSKICLIALYRPKSFQILGLNGDMCIGGLI